MKSWWGTQPPETWAGLRLQQKLKDLKDQEKAWNSTSFGNVSQGKEELLHKIQVLDEGEAMEGLTDDLSSERNQLKEEFQEVTAREDIKWRQNQEWSDWKKET